MEYHVINLTRRQDRLVEFKKRATAANLDENNVHILPAHDGKTLELTPEIESLFHVSNPETFVGKRVPRHHGWNAAAIACALSHIQLWKQLISKTQGPEGTPEPCFVIFEDDVFFSPSFQDRWNKIYETELKQDPKWQICFLGLSFDFDFYSDVQRTQHVRECLTPGRWYGSGLHAYCLRLSGAKRLLEFAEQLKIQQPIDHFIVDQIGMSPNFTVYKLTPKLCFADHYDQVWEHLRADSDIQHSARILKEIPNKKYYSLYGLDRFLEEYCIDLTKPKQFFVDIGCRDGLVNSPTKLLQDHGFHGICVEFMPHHFVHLVKNRGSKETVMCPDLILDADKTGLNVAYQLPDGSIAQLQRVTAKTMTTLCQDSNVSTIDVLALQIETTQLATLLGIDFEKLRINVILIFCSENKQREDPTKSDIYKCLRKHSFRYLLRLGDCHIYLGPSYWHRRLQVSEKFRELIGSLLIPNAQTQEFR
jgi:GR25 family glycosyltransferase involved in LPS biosynthesis